jgi:NADPH:quinone reductase-like Zn-dependent oxidoreductase
VHHVVVSEDATVAREFAPYRLILESVGGRVLADAVSMLGPDGVCVFFGASAGGAEVQLNPWSLVRAGRATLYGFLLFNELVHEPAALGLARLAGFVAGGRLRPHISVEAPWTEIGPVAQDLLGRRIAGKAVLSVAD